MSTTLDPEQLAAELHDARNAMHELCKEVRLLMEVLCYPQHTSLYTLGKALNARVDSVNEALIRAEAS